MTPTDRSPTRLSATASGIAAATALIASGLYSWHALSAGAVGFVLVAGGLLVGARSAVTLGCLGLFIGALVAGSQSAPVEPVVLSVTAMVLAWDLGSTAISLGRQLGRTATTVRLELVHLAVSGGVGLGTVGGGYLVFTNATGGQLLSTVILLVVATVILLTAIRFGSDDASSA